MSSNVHLPRDKHLAKAVLEADAERRTREMGKIGEFLGARENAAVYFAFVIVLVALVIAGVVAIHEPSLRADLLKSVLGLAAIAAGFMFGSGLRKD